MGFDFMTHVFGLEWKFSLQFQLSITVVESIKPLRYFQILSYPSGFTTVILKVFCKELQLGSIEKEK